MERLKPKVIIFDLDGTLVKFKLNVNAAKLDIIKLLRQLGVDVAGFTIHTGVQEMINEAVKQLGEDKEKSIREKVLSIMEKYESIAASQAEARDGAETLLKKLRERGYKIIVATNTNKEAARKSLEKANLIHLIDDLITRNDAERLKPSGDILRKVLERFSITPEQAVYIGDSIHDVMAAKEVGIPFIGLEGGIHSRSQLIENSAKIVLKNPVELLEFLN